MKKRMDQELMKKINLGCGGDCRKGFAFNNPDITSNGGWGCMITPDELRYVFAFSPH